jgi:glycosyltransferase involved in cell wall biosynthesis
MANPRFTFCIPNLNKIDFLPACIESMLAQDCDDWCCVFVDGFSTDGCWEYMQKFADDPRFRLMRGLKNGMYADWNYCLAQVRTEYFYILTSDDTCSSNLVSETMKALEEYPRILACHFPYSLIDVSGRVIHEPEDLVRMNFDIYLEPNRSPHIRSGLSEFMFHFVYRTLYKSITSLVMRRSLIDRLCGFSQEYGSAGDFDWAMRLCLETDILFLPESLATWRMYDGQATKDSDVLYHARQAWLIGSKNLGNDKLRSFNKTHVLSGLRDDYFLTFTRCLMSRQNLSLVVGELKFMPLNAYGIYLFKIAVRLLSCKTFFKYRNRNQFTQELVDRYNLQWPPVKVLRPNEIFC